MDLKGKIYYSEAAAFTHNYARSLIKKCNSMQKWKLAMSKKLAIAMFCQKRLSRKGGVEIVVISTRMASKGCAITCYNRSGHHVSGAEFDNDLIEYEGVRQISVPTINKIGLAAVSSSMFASLFSALGRYNLVHIHAEGPAFFVGFQNY